MNEHPEFNFNPPGPSGTISEEVEKILGMRHQTCSARRTDLRASGYTTYLLENGKKVQRLTTAGSPAYVEIATQKGIDAIRHGTSLWFKDQDPTSAYHGGTETSEQAFAKTPRSQDARRVLEIMVRFS